MSVIVRVWWTFFTAFPIQRWLSVFGFGLLCVGVGASLLGVEARFSVPLGLAAFLVFAGFPGLFAAGALLRALSAPQSHRLLPFFRVRMLVAILALVAAVALIAYALGWALSSGTGRNVPIEVSLIYPVGILTAAILTMFVICGQWNWVWLELPLLIAFLHWMDAEGPASLRETGVSLPWLVGVGAASAWLIFAVWYLRVRQIRPLMLFPAAGNPNPCPAAWAEAPSRAAAGRALVAGSLERPFTQGLMIAAALGIVVGAGAPLLSFLPGQTARPPPLTAFVWPFWVMLGMSSVAYRLVRQSRLLWLYVPGARPDVLRFVEAAIARRYGGMVILISTVAALALLLFPAAPIETAWGLALALSAALYACCLAIASVRGLALFIVGFMLMAVVQVAGLGGFEQPPRTIQLSTVVVVQLAGAVLLRALAVRRWRSIDWLQFRPVRWP